MATSSLIPLSLVNMPGKLPDEFEISLDDAVMFSLDVSLTSIAKGWEQLDTKLQAMGYQTRFFLDHATMRTCLQATRRKVAKGEAILQ
jgi:hypothetical protein